MAYQQPNQPQQPYYPPPVHQHVHVTVRRGPNHLLHGILTVVTCGLWGIVWVGVIIYNAARR